MKYGYSIYSLCLNVCCLLAVALFVTCCHDDLFDRSDTLSPVGSEMVDVSLCIGLEQPGNSFPQEDASSARSLHTGSSGTTGDTGFYAEPESAAGTRAGEEQLTPDQLYNLELGLYKADGSRAFNVAIGTKAIGEYFTASMPAGTYQLVLIARGASGLLGSIGTNSLSGVRSNIRTTLDAISKIPVAPATSSEMNNMPYVLYLENVTISADNKITSPEGKDVRLLLKRLAARVTLQWDFAVADYELKEVSLQQVPKLCRALPTSNGLVGGVDTYPSSVDEYTEAYRLREGDTGFGNEGKYTVWVPANVRGLVPKVVNPSYRSIDNAPVGAMYAEFRVEKESDNKRLLCRVYIGGNATTDFNVRENTDYTWNVGITKADVADDRVREQSLTSVGSTNKVNTTNCIMLEPGGDLCFNPYQHSSGTSGWNDYLMKNPGSAPEYKTAIASVKVLWQTRDAGTVGELVLGYGIDATNHQNLVHLTDGNDINKALIHVKAPLTKGGNALIAAYDATGTTVLWSWHLWITDYVPVPLKGEINASTRAAAITTAQTATRNGAVQVYQGISWTDPTAAFYKCVIMDRNLGATKAGIQDNLIDGVRTFGLLYQAGRKDPFFSTADGTAEEKNTIYDAMGGQAAIAKRGCSSLDVMVKNPMTYNTGGANVGGSWNGSKPKTIYDPCPDGWRVPCNEVSSAAQARPSSTTDASTKRCMMAGFGSSNPSLVYEYTRPQFNNVMYYNGSNIVSLNTTAIQTSSFVGSGFVYYGTSAGPGGDTSIFFPGVSLREGNGNYRTSVKNNSVFIWSSTVEGSNLKIYQMQDNYMDMRHTVDTKYGFSVRCVQDNVQ